MDGAAERNDLLSGKITFLAVTDAAAAAEFGLKEFGMFASAFEKCRHKCITVLVQFIHEAIECTRCKIFFTFHVLGPS